MNFSIKQDEHIDTICLPRYGEEFEKGERCWVTGWGKDQFGKTYFFAY